MSATCASMVLIKPALDIANTVQAELTGWAVQPVDCHVEPGPSSRRINSASVCLRLRADHASPLNYRAGPVAAFLALPPRGGRLPVAELRAEHLSAQPGHFLARAGRVAPRPARRAHHRIRARQGAQPHDVQQQVRDRRRVRALARIAAVPQGGCAASAHRSAPAPGPPSSPLAHSALAWQ